MTRCRALAQGFLDRGWRILFATTETSHDILDHIRKDGCETRVMLSNRNLQEEITWLVPLLKEMHPTVLVLDGYDFDDTYQQLVKPWTRCLLCLDDVPKRRFACDVLLNQNIGVSKRDYEGLVCPETRVVFGSRYALLRKEYQAYAGYYQVRARPKRVLVTLGGADKQNHTPDIVRECARLPEIEIDVVFGPMYQFEHKLGGTSTRIHLHEGLDSLLELACQADLAVTAGGSTVWELACLGIPMVVVGTAENQGAVLKGLIEHRAAVVLGPIEKVSSHDIAREVGLTLSNPSRLQEISRAATGLVDGKGVARMVAMVEEVSGQSEYRGRVSLGAVQI